MTAPPRIIRKHKLPQYLGLGKTKVQELIDQGQLAVFPLTEGGRAKGALEDDIIALQQRLRERATAPKVDASAAPPAKPRIKRCHLEKSR